MLAAVPTSPAFPSRGVPLRGSSARRGRCSNLPFHAKLLHGLSSAAAAAFHVAAPAPPRARRSDPGPFFRKRLPHGDGLARPARIATAGSPAHACHTGTAVATRFESPLRDYPAPPATSGTGCRLGTRCVSPSRSAAPSRFSATGCHTRRLGATRLNGLCGFPGARLPHGYTRRQRDRVETELNQT